MTAPLAFGVHCPFAGKRIRRSNLVTGVLQGAIWAWIAVRFTERTGISSAARVGLFNIWALEWTRMCQCYLGLEVNRRLVAT